MVEDLHFGGVKITCLLFAHEVVYFTSSGSDLQLTVGWSTAESGAAGVKISISNSEDMVFSQERVECPLWVRGELLACVEFMYLWVLFPSEGSRRLTDVKAKQFLMITDQSKFLPSPIPMSSA